jgi:hypothetical protein
MLRIVYLPVNNHVNWPTTPNLPKTGTNWQPDSNSPILANLAIPSGHPTDHARSPKRANALILGLTAGEGIRPARPPAAGVPLPLEPGDHPWGCGWSGWQAAG